MSRFGYLVVVGLIAGCANSAPTGVSDPAPTQPGLLEIRPLVGPNPMHIEVGRYEAVASWGTRTEFKVLGACSKQGQREDIDLPSLDRMLRATIKSPAHRVIIRRSPDLRPAQVQRILDTLHEMPVDADILPGPQLGTRRCIPTSKRHGRSLPTQISRRGLAPSVVRGVINDSVERVRDCYAAGLARDKDLWGKIVVSFLIQADGRVFDVEVNENTVDRVVAQCVAQVTKGLVYPRSKSLGTTRVTYPFVFGKKPVARASARRVDARPVKIRVGIHYADAIVAGAIQPEYSARGGCSEGRRVPIAQKVVGRVVQSALRRRRTAIDVAFAPNAGKAQIQYVTGILSRFNVEARVSVDTSSVSGACSTWQPAAPKVAAARMGSSSAPASIGPSLDKSEVQAPIAAALSTLKDCYKDYLFANPEAAGRVIVRFVVGPDGRVRGSEIVENTVGREVAACILKVVSGLGFAEPRGGGYMSVTYPFVFAAR